MTLVSDDKSKQEVSYLSPGFTQVKGQTSHPRPGWEWVESSVWTENMLTTLVNGVKGGKWFSLIDKVYRPLTLLIAWKKVRRNKGAGGIDNISIERFQEKASVYLEELHKELKEGTYQAKAVKRVYIPKGDGKKRPLGIPTIKDRIVQMAVKIVIEPILENDFCDMSYGFRPKRGCKGALKEVQHWLDEGYNWVLDADLKSYFDTIPHDELMEKLENYISDGRILALIKGWLKQDIMEEGKSWIPTEGSPQGAVISPLLANLYLNDLDKLMTGQGIKIVRYADDFVILTKSKKNAEILSEIVDIWTKENGLTIHPDKTHIGNWQIEGQGFEFLGYRFEQGKRWVRQKSILKFRDTIRKKTKRTCGKSILDIIDDLNKTLRGWYNYFKHVNKWNMKTFDGFVRRRLRAVLRKQQKRPGFGRCPRDHMKWPNAYFANLGLFTMETTRALEVASRSR